MVVQRSVKERVVRAAFIAMGVLTATPVLVVLLPSQLESYGVVDPDPVVLPLLQHRGVLQLLAGSALVWAGFRPDVRVPVAAAVIVAKAGWLTLTLSSEEAREVASPVALVFDPLCIVVLGLVLVDVARSGVDRYRHPSVPGPTSDVTGR